MGAWDVDLSTGSSIWSRQHFEMLGYAPSPDGNATIELWRDRVHPEDRAEVDRRIQEALATGARYISEHRILRFDNREHRWLSEFGHVVRSDSGEPVRFLGVSFDITARKRAEEEQARTAERLHRANADLEQFAYSASHDLQEPLRGVRVYSELLAMELEGRLSQNERDYLAQVCDAAERMEILLRDLSSYIEAWGIQDEGMKSVDAGACLTAALANLATTIRTSGASVKQDSLPWLPVDSTRLHQVFQNLVANAIKYRNPGTPPEIYVRAERQGNMWCFRVKDNGIGISPDFHHQIFGLFKRLHSRQHYAGSGIGLAICARIVEQYGGRIWVESTPGEGATFCFTLPA
jgi:PAS domain S-box-containing protein